MTEVLLVGVGTVAVCRKANGGRMTDFIPRDGEAICKVCGMPHPIDEWRGVKYYYCPESERVYLVAKEKKND